MAYQKCAGYERASLAISGTAPQKFLNIRVDMEWLREVHLPELGEEYLSAMVYGNGDSPDAIECYLVANPEVTDRPQIWVRIEED